MSIADSGDLERALRTDLTAWQRRYPGLRDRDIAGLAPLIVRHLPAAAAEDRVLAMLVSLWIIGFDDLVDEDQLPPAALAAQAERYIRQAAGGPDGGAATTPAALASAEQLDQLLADLTAWVTRFAAPPPVTAAWRTAFARMVRAIVAQRELSRRAAVAGPPDPALTEERLFPILKESSGLPCYLATALLIARDASVVDRWPAVLAIIDACAGAVRLANDLRTWPKDEREGSLNMLVVFEAGLAGDARLATPADRRAQALADLRRRLEQAVADTHARLAASPRPDGPWEQGVGRLVDAATAWYRDHGRAAS